MSSNDVNDKTNVEINDDNDGKDDDEKGVGVPDLRAGEKSGGEPGPRYSGEAKKRKF